MVDISDPSNPDEVAFIAGSASGVKLVDDFAYVANGQYLLMIVDISDPSMPIQIGGVPSASESRDVVVAGPNIFVASFEAGLDIVRGCHHLFVDGFESGDTSSWPATIP